VSHDGRRPAILAVDTATTQVVVASGSPDGELDGLTTWVAGYRHGETLLPAIARFLNEQNLRRSRLTGIVVGTGPGAFTGLRVGIATAKGLAHGLGLPIAGISTAEAMLAAATADAEAADTEAAVRAGPHAALRGRPVLLLPAGPNDRVLVRQSEGARLLPGGTDPELAPGEWLVAVDLGGRAPDEAIARGEYARHGLGRALVRMGAERLRDGAGDDLAGLVPEYVTLPRGVAAQVGEVAWSRDRR
jgi:tRNA threonylcarbamoyl adenosine modification protein YeaZ